MFETNDFKDGFQRNSNMPRSDAESAVKRSKDRTVCPWGAPFAFVRLSSFGSLGRAAGLIIVLPPECLQNAGTGPLFGSGPADREGLLHYMMILLRSCLIECELDCSAPDGGAAAS